MNDLVICRKKTYHGNEGTSGYYYEEIGPYVPNAAPWVIAQCDPSIKAITHYNKAATEDQLKAMTASKEVDHAEKLELLHQHTKLVNGSHQYQRGWLDCIEAVKQLLAAYDASKGEK